VQTNENGKTSTFYTIAKLNVACCISS